MSQTLAIFGISGRTGRELCHRALSRGWQVRGHVRSESGAFHKGDGLTLVRGAFSEPERVVEVIAGTTAVCCVIGPRPPFTDVFCAAATAAIIEGMMATGCQRLVCQTGAMIGTAPNRTRPMEWMARTFANRHPAIAQDRLAQERLVQSSTLRWTIVKPPRLTSSPPAMRAEASPTLRVGLLSRIGRSDLAEFILNEVANPVFLGQRVFVKG